VTGAQNPIGIAIIGAGKIARDQHAPTILNDSRFRLAATADPAGGLVAIPSFPNLTRLLSDGPGIDAVAICTPPHVRAQNAAVAIEAGLHVLLEKPPATTVSALEALRALAIKQGVTLFAAFHSRHAPMVHAARQWLTARPVRRGSIIWREDFRHWHPGQAWLCTPGGFGVFDPGINALSILTQILPRPVAVQSAEFEVPKNWQAPIAARLSLMTAGAAIATDFDFRHDSPRTWNIEIEAETGETLSLREGGDSLSIDGGPEIRACNAEYKGIYTRFSDLIAAGESDVDATPLQLVADAFRIARTAVTESFDP
jgi:predicted dehydrogenase